MTTQRRGSKFVDCLAAVALAALILAALGVGHGANEYYPKKFKRSDPSLNYGFASDVPNGDFRNRVEDGAQEWNPLSPALHYVRGSVHVNFGFANCSMRDLGENSTHYGNIDGRPNSGFNTYATTTHCVFSDSRDKLFSFAIKFDNSENWNRGSSGPGSGEVDLHAVSAHEFGHAGGFKGPYNGGHFDPSAGLCDLNAPKQTMCQGLPYGEQFWRSLEEHDKHTFKNAYG